MSFLPVILSNTRFNLREGFGMVRHSDRMCGVDDQLRNVTGSLVMHRACFPNMTGRQTFTLSRSGVQT